MPSDETHFNSIYRRIIANSLFTDRQTYIIYKSLLNRNSVRNISRGAYYRQVKQCRRKIIRVLYSSLLLQSLGAFDPMTLSVLQTLSERLGVISLEASSDITDTKAIDNLMQALDHTLKKMCNM